jgi:hypothetical protein
MEVTAHPRCAAALQMRLPGDGVLAVFCVDVGVAGDGVYRGNRCRRRLRASFSLLRP